MVESQDFWRTVNRHVSFSVSQIDLSTSGLLIKLTFLAFQQRMHACQRGLILFQVALNPEDLPKLCRDYKHFDITWIGTISSPQLMLMLKFTFSNRLSYLCSIVMIGWREVLTCNGRATLIKLFGGLGKRVITSARLVRIAKISYMTKFLNPSLPSRVLWQN
jgi:hypothetical protein